METSREGSLKFFAINLAECITWKEHRDLVKNKASKIISVLYKGSKGLDFECLRSKHIYFLYIPS